LKNLFLFSIFFTSFAFASLPDFKRNPVVYGVSASFLSRGYNVKGLRAVTMRLPEIKALGANIVWLQPITPPFEQDGHGYDVMEYKEIWKELGTEQDLKHLVSEAHRLGLRIMLDVVLNHSSAEHPFIKDIEKKGKSSAYYEFYQHDPIAHIPYARHFHGRMIGGEEFIYYFWQHLVNFNYDSPKLREYLFDVLRFWVKKFDIDGYRFDASWGPSTRWPKFYKTVSTELRKLKPEIILMAEDMAGYPRQYEGSGHPHLKGSGFDWAYDWNNEDPDYISKWSFQTGDDYQETIFNEHSPRRAADYFMQAVTYGNSVDGIKTVRYIENNDTPGSLRYHSVKQAMWAAKVTFVLPGVPLIFYGQEVGNKHDTFNLPSFDPKKKMASHYPELWSFYQNLVMLRRKSASLSEGKLTDLRRVSPTLVTFRRSAGNDSVLVKLDFKNKEVYLNELMIR
jgi:glycosidase